MLGGKRNQRSLTGSDQQDKTDKARITMPSGQAKILQRKLFMAGGLFFADWLIQLTLLSDRITATDPNIAQRSPLVDRIYGQL